MLLDLGHQQDLALLLFGDFKGVGTGDALTFRMDRQGQGQSIERRYMKYRLQNEFDKIHGCVIVVIDDDIPHARTFCLNLILFEKIEPWLSDRFNSVWTSLL
jgi:hypothetical protein